MAELKKYEILETTHTKNYIIIRLSRKNYYNDQWLDLEKWMNQTSCGKRVNYNSITFKTEAELMLFQLKWT